jgi:integrase
MQLYSNATERLYINTAERKRLITVACSAEPKTAALCLILLFTGCRLSEALALQLDHVQVEPATVCIRSLKKRNQNHIREIPIPSEIAVMLQGCFEMQESSTHLWKMSRTTAWRLVKELMKSADISGKRASPKGLRHGFAVNCAFSNVPMPLCQKWMGHSSIETTAIYYQIVGPDERNMARRSWQ